MDTLEIISKVFGGLGTIGLFIVLTALWKMGFFRKNGNGKNEIKELKEAVENLKGNDLTHIDLKLEKLIEIGQRSLFILEELKEELKDKK